MTNELGQPFGMSAAMALDPDLQVREASIEARIFDDGSEVFTVHGD
jgi:hypothetical protein